MAVDPYSDTWKTIEAWAVKGIEAARDRLEGGMLPPNGPGSNDGMAARCQALRELLNLAKPKPLMQDEADYHD